MPLFCFNHWPCLWALDNKIFVNFPSSEKHRRSFSSYHTRPDSGCSREGTGPIKGAAGPPPSPAQQVARELSPPLCLISSCFLCLFVLLVWVPVLSISHLVFPALFSGGFLLAALRSSTGRPRPLYLLICLWSCLDVVRHMCMCWGTQGSAAEFP